MPLGSVSGLGVSCTNPRLIMCESYIILVGTVFKVLHLAPNGKLFL